MKKLKIIVYAICKNEEKFVDRWVNSMKEADNIYVLDTGSTDNSVEKLKKLGVKVKSKIINPWRFDVARNESLKLVPCEADICVCTDLDEIFVSGWRKKLENNWQEETTRVRYNYNWLLDEKNNPKVNFYIEKIHARKGYEWVHPVHEVLKYKLNNEKFVLIDNLTLNHYPDWEKSRGSYLSLLELSVKEEPDDDRNMHYLGREYMYYKKWNKCIHTLKKHLSLPSAIWKDERCASMRFIARSYVNLKKYNKAKIWLNKAIKEAPYLRDPYVEMALLEFELKNYINVIVYCEKALLIKEHPKTYINEQFSFDGTIYDLLSVSFYYTNNLDKSLKNIDIALEYNHNDKRLLDNKEIILKSIGNNPKVN